MGQHSGWTFVGESQSRQLSKAFCGRRQSKFLFHFSKFEVDSYLETTRNGRESDVVIDELAEHGHHHGVAPVHVAHVLVDDDGDEARRRERLAGDGAPARTGDAVVVSGRQQPVERGERLAERRVAQVVAEAAELAEGRRVVARKRLLVVVAARVRGGGRLNEARHVHIVQSLRERTRQTAEQVVQHSVTDLALHSSEFRSVRNQNIDTSSKISNYLDSLFKVVQKLFRSVLQEQRSIGNDESARTGATESRVDAQRRLRIGPRV